jgi:hypothetical protein
MDDKLWRKLRLFALKNGMSTSEAVRRAVEFAWFDSTTELPPTTPVEAQPQQEEVPA